MNRLRAPRWGARADGGGGVWVVEESRTISVLAYDANARRSVRFEADA
ncbi:MAG: hypothetical protein KIT22_03075 [Verrucomicrobiae bacterium]|nr:hypothetical protein [Verrucomicrobiae bacterium]